MLRQLGDCAVALDGGQSHLRLEGGRVVPAGSSAHGFSCSRRLSPLSGRNSTYRLVQISGTGSLRDLGFDGVDPAATGRPAYHPSPMLKLYIYGYLNRVQSSRRLEREAGRNLEVMWLTGRLAPDHKTIADFRKDNGPAIKKVCAPFVELCRKMGLLAKASVAIHGSQFKPPNARD